MAARRRVGGDDAKGIASASFAGVAGRIPALRAGARATLHPAVATLDGVATGPAHHAATGTVEWFNAQKGFGFIQPEDGGKDVFVHITAVQTEGLQDLAENQRVTYEVVAERGKRAAANLKLA